MATVDINGTLVDFPDELTPDQLQTAVSQAATQLGAAPQAPPSMQQRISSMARPALEVGGAMVGGAAGSGLGPAGTAAGGALGFAGGRSAADLLDRTMGLKKSLVSIPEAVGEAGGNIYSGAKNEAAGQLIGGALSPVAEKFLARRAGEFGRIQSGVRQEAGQRLFRNPKAFLAPSTEAVGKELGAVREEAGMLVKPTVSEIVDTEGSLARKTAKTVLKKLESNTKPRTVQEMDPLGIPFSRELPPDKPPLTPAELLKGKQAINKLIEKLPIMQRTARRLLSQAGQKISDKLYEIAPQERGVAAKYANSALAEEFRKFYPVTRNGDVSLTRTLFLPAFREPGELAAAIPTIAGQSPFLGGAAIAAAGGAYKGAQKVLGGEMTRRGMVSAIHSLIAEALSKRRGSNGQQPKQ